MFFYVGTLPFYIDDSLVNFAQLSPIFCCRLKEDFVVVHCSFLFGWVFIKDLPAWLVWELQVRCVGPLGVPSSSYIIVRIIFEDVSLRGAEPASFFIDNYFSTQFTTPHLTMILPIFENVKVCCSSCFQALVFHFSNNAVLFSINFDD